MKNTITKQYGFTLVGLLISVVILGILMAVGVPSLQSTTLSGTLRSYSNQLTASAALARSEALKRNAVVNMCVSADGATCTTGDWNQGWIVYLPSDSSVIARQQALDGAYKITSTDDDIDFQPSGIGAGQANITVCRSSPTAGNQERIVSISATGRTMVTKTETGTCS